MDITYILEAGKRVVASKFNTNFNDVKTAVDALETDVADLQAEASNAILPDGSKDFTNLQSYKANAINNATNATPIVITAVAHGYVTGNKVFIKDVGGNTAANGEFTITRLTADTFSLNSSVGNGAYTSGGTAVIYPDNDENLTDKQYVDNKTNAEFEKAKAHFGSSSTAAATAEKAFTITGATLTRGAIFEIACSTANTATTPTININSLGAKALKFLDGIGLDATHYCNLNTANLKMLVIYDGTDFIIQSKAKYDSGEFAIASNGTYTLTHNLGSKQLKVTLVGLTTTGGKEYEFLKYFDASSANRAVTYSNKSTTQTDIFVGVNPVVMTAVATAAIPTICKVYAEAL